MSVFPMTRATPTHPDLDELYSIPRDQLLDIGDIEIMDYNDFDVDTDFDQSHFHTTHHAALLESQPDNPNELPNQTALYENQRINAIYESLVPTRNDESMNVYSSQDPITGDTDLLNNQGCSTSPNTENEPGAVMSQVPGCSIRSTNGATAEASQIRLHTSQIPDTAPKTPANKISGTPCDVNIASKFPMQPIAYMEFRRLHYATIIPDDFASLQKLLDSVKNCPNIAKKRRRLRVRYALKVLEDSALVYRRKRHIPFVKPNIPANVKDGEQGIEELLEGCFPQPFDRRNADLNYLPKPLIDYITEVNRNYESLSQQTGLTEWQQSQAKRSIRASALKAHLSSFRVKECGLYSMVRSICETMGYRFTEATSSTAVNSDDRYYVPFYTPRYLGPRYMVYNGNLSDTLLLALKISWWHEQLPGVTVESITNQILVVLNNTMKALLR